MKQCHCGGEYSDARHSLGYRTCLPCGEKEAKQRKFCVAPMAKSNYILITNPEMLKQLNKRANT